MLPIFVPFLHCCLKICGTIYRLKLEKERVILVVANCWPYDIPQLCLLNTAMRKIIHTLTTPS
uniref:Uncharacterized protein n=1 Tax=Rhizophora mucronata TaxID=61149 RepID=A0A2P2P5T0_RHIMU